MKGFIKTLISIGILIQPNLSLAEAKASETNQTKQNLSLSESRMSKTNQTMNIKAKRNINLYKAWEITKGSPEIIVAVVDTGLDLTHQAFSHKENVWTNKGETGTDSLGRDKRTNGVDDDGNGYIDDVHGANLLKDTGDITDNHGHGTHISGLIAGRDSSSDFFGIAPYVKIMSLKYFDPEDSSNAAAKGAVKAFKYAVENGAHIINFSGGGANYISSEATILAKAEEKGISVIVAAGNEMETLDSEPLSEGIIRDIADSKEKNIRSKSNGQYYPCMLGEIKNNKKRASCIQDTDKDGVVDCEDFDIDGDKVMNTEDFDPMDKKIQTVAQADKKSILCIGSLDLDQTLSRFSNVGKKQVDMFAPGNNIISSSGKYYGSMNGTSQATAIATGVVALVKSIIPEASPKRIKEILSLTVVKDESYKEMVKTSGRIDAYKALKMAQEERKILDLKRAKEVHDKQAEANKDQPVSNL